MYKRFLFSFICCLILMSCAPVSKLPSVDQARAEAERAKQYELLIQDQLAQWQRLHRVSYPILLKNAHLCGENVWKSYSFKLITADFFGKKLRKHAVNTGISDRPYVVSVVGGSSSAQAGVKKGDILKTIGDWDIPEEGYKDSFNEKLKDYAKDGDTIAMTFLRNGRDVSIDVPLELTCSYSVKLSADSLVNAFADGKSIIFTTGIMNLLKSDSELAAVVGHEIAHNTMGHIDKKTGNYALGAVVDILFAGLGVNTGGAFADAAAGAFSQEFESEADYVGLYYMHNAGFPIEDAPNVWRRMSLSNPSSIKDDHRSSHPSSPERFVALEETIKEIQEKIANGDALIPDKEEESLFETTPVETQPDTDTR